MGLTARICGDDSRLAGAPVRVSGRQVINQLHGENDEMAETVMTGGCRCDALRYRIEGEPLHASVCHCEDCRRSAGAPCVAWMAIEQQRFVWEKGEATQWTGNGVALRQFCPSCGTGLAYINETMLPGLVDVAIATLDNPALVPPQIQIQKAEMIPWLESSMHLPAFDRYPV